MASIDLSFASCCFLRWFLRLSLDFICSFLRIVTLRFDRCIKLQIFGEVFFFFKDLWKVERLLLGCIKECINRYYFLTKFYVSCNGFVVSLKRWFRMKDDRISNRRAVVGDRTLQVEPWAIGTTGSNNLLNSLSLVLILSHSSCLSPIIIIAFLKVIRGRQTMRILFLCSAEPPIKRAGLRWKQAGRDSYRGSWQGVYRSYQFHCFRDSLQLQLSNEKFFRAKAVTEASVPKYTVGLCCVLEAWAGQDVRLCYILTWLLKVVSVVSCQKKQKRLVAWGMTAYINLMFCLIINRTNIFFFN